MSNYNEIRTDTSWIGAYLFSPLVHVAHAGAAGGKFFFLWHLIRTRKSTLALAFALCILFNFLLHLNYGYEPFLYSPDWAYALIFFIALVFAPLAGNRFFQGGLFLFLIFLAYNQFQFFQFIFETVAPFLPPGG